MKSTFFLTLLAGAVLTGFTQTAAQAQTPAIAETFDQNFVSGYSGSVGYEFSLSSNETLNQLGVYDVGNAGQTAATVPVGIWDASGNLLASTTITVPNTTGAGGDQGNFDFSAQLTFSDYSNGFTGTLLGGTGAPVYFIAEESGNGTVSVEGFENDGKGATSIDPAVTLIASRYSGSNGFAFPDQQDHNSTTDQNSNAYVGPNFTFGAATTPEPSTYALLGAGVLVLILMQRRKAFFR